MPGKRSRPARRPSSRSTATGCTSSILRRASRSPARRARACSPPEFRVTRDEKAREFEALHASEPFVIPNPWDAGSARVLAALGFKALATTSSGFAFSLGRRDGGATLDEVVRHAAELDAATDLPVSVDLENGYGAEPSEAARAVTAVAEAG